MGGGSKGIPNTRSWGCPQLAKRLTYLEPKHDEIPHATEDELLRTPEKAQRGCCHLEDAYGCLRPVDDGLRDLAELGRHVGVRPQELDLCV